jgi:transcriptional regulator NrdR family protein
MKCPHPNCGAWARVLSTRESGDGVRRRHECANLHRFSSVERPVGFSPQATRLTVRNMKIRDLLKTKSVNEVAAHFNVSRVTVWRATREPA